MSLAHLGWYASCVLTGQVAEFLQHPCGPAGAATTHDVQRKHEAAAASRRTDLQQLSSELLSSSSLPSSEHIHTRKAEHSSSFFFFFLSGLMRIPPCSWPLPMCCSNQWAVLPQELPLDRNHGCSGVHSRILYIILIFFFLNVYLLYMQIVKITNDLIECNLCALIWE